MAWLVNPGYTIFLIVNKTSSLPFSTSNHTNPHSNKYNYHWCHCLATCLINCQHWWLTWQTQFAASCHWRRHCHVNFLSPSIINHLKNCLSNWQWQILRQKTLVLSLLYLSKTLEIWRMYNCYRLIFQEKKNASSLDLFYLINKSYLDLFFRKSYIARPFNGFTYLISVPK